MGVAHSQKDAAAKASKDLLAMVKTGAQDLADDLANQVKLKKTEAARLADLVESTRAQAENEDTEYPLEIVYVYTIRDASQGLVTKTAAYTPSDTKEANSAADSLEKSIPGRTKLADLMVIELKKRQAQVAAMTKTLPDFVDSSQTILLEVLANLQ